MGDVLNSLSDTLSGFLKAGVGGETINAGFGKFKVVARKERSGRNPATGDPITIKASKSLGFKASSSL